MTARLFFATDVHGSEVCWRKFINSAKHYDANILILGGDMTGKAVVPIIDQGAGRYYYHMQDIRHEFEGSEALALETRAIRDHGYYAVVMTADQRDEYTSDPDKFDELFHEQMRKTVADWVEWADGKSGRLRAPVHRLPRQRRPPRHRRDPRGVADIQVGEGNVLDLSGRLSARLERLDQPHAVGHAP